MSILEGGIFSNPRGKTGGIVFGAARTRTGKKVTSRLLVPPSNPNTAAQQIQRGNFAEALAIVRLIGPSVYQSDFNRSIGQLPGFQSMTSIFLNAMDSSSNIGVIPSINLGSLHVPATISFATGTGTGMVNAVYSQELGINGTALDVAVVIGVETAKASSPLERIIVIDTSMARDDGLTEFGPFSSAVSVTALLYFRGDGTADGLLSATTYGEATSAT